MSPSDKSLRHWFNRYNKAYFDGSLPEDTQLIWEACSADASTCPVYEAADGKFIIRMEPGIKGFPLYWKATLLHEMVHIDLWAKFPKHQHGKAFNARMLKLAQDGAFKKVW